MYSPLRPPIGIQRDWSWRGWQARYSFLPPEIASEDRPPLLFIHGFGASIGHWRQNIPYFAQHHPVYALDLVGFGASEKIEQAFNVDFWVQQVHDFWHTLIQTPVILVGNSIGSLVCMAIAAQYPDLCRGVVLLNLPDTTLREEMIPTWVRPWVTRIEQLFTTPLILKPLFYLLRSPALLKRWARLAYHDGAAVTEELMEILALPTRDRGAAQTFVCLFQSMPKASFGPSAKLTLPRIQAPILLLWGQQDRMVMPHFGHQFARCNPQITHVQLEQAGHCPQDERPEQVNAILADWMDKQGLGAVASSRCAP
ncbi:alpha/beta fold hydrolase [Lyngbya confervoides]|uniref:Alpha/beta fold hydrolase n=1 Tax=Lyngbya confervoides BDU141951 TaxID=1574623 RepID=A0ABD4T220_9CYAN|nr:alpha/beta fold hydrolase [Lyngbya confervoides]MCM1982728.1 alpha/beta fold hydrolase [Lyngbya confervoides BDU141951]